MPYLCVTHDDGISVVDLPAEDVHGPGLQGLRPDIKLIFICPNDYRCSLFCRNQVKAAC